jgi:uncharacterized protein (DUF1330 family)
MTKGYWVAQVDIDDAESYQTYIAANAAPFARFGAKFLVRGGKGEVVEGVFRTKVVVIEFPSVEAARACYDSPEYQAAKALREPAARADLVIIEGYDA